jgi:hypothetical protein
MFRFTLRDLLWLTVVVALGIAWWLQSLRWEQERRRLAAELKNAKVLSDMTNIEFIETPLERVVAYLSDVHGAPISLDLATLKQVGLDEKSPVTANVKGASLRAALKIMLADKAEFVATEDGLLIKGRDPARLAKRKPVVTSSPSPSADADPFGAPMK